MTPLSSDPNDLEALTPGHFLIGTPLNAIPDTEYQHKNITSLKRWHLVQALFQSFWTRWQKEYITSLQQRHKWKTKGHKFDVGDLVLVAEDNTPPLHWPLGRIIKTFLGNDHVARVVELKTQKGTYNRPVIKLHPLPHNY